MRFPVPTLPVNTSLSIGAPSRAAPAGPSPTTTWNTSRGSAASCSSDASSSATTGVNSDGLSTTAFPATSAASDSVDGIENG